MNIRPVPLSVVVPALLALCGIPDAAEGASKSTASPKGAPTALIKAMARLVKQQDSCAGLTAAYADGSGFHGWTRVKLDEGRVEVTHSKRGGRGEQRYTGSARPAECKQLLQATLKGKLWKVRSARRMGVPDETRPSLKIGIEDRGAIEITLWAGEARKSRSFGSVQQAMLKIAKRVSGGKVTY